MNTADPNGYGQRTKTVDIPVRFVQNCVPSLTVGAAEVKSDCWQRSGLSGGGVTWRTRGDITVNGLLVHGTAATTNEAFVPNDPSKPGTLTTNGQPVSITVKGQQISKEPMSWTLPSAAAAVPAPATARISGRASEVKIGGIGPSSPAFTLFGFDLTSPYGIEWFSGTYADGRTYTRIQVDLKVPGFSIPTTEHGKSPDVSV